MMYRHGLRCSEAVDLRRDDVSLDRATLWVRRLKGSNSGMHPIEGDELRAIRRYLATRNDGLPWLFVSERQGRLTRFAVNYLVDRTAKAAGFENLHPHCLRHSCGYALADKGVDLRTIQEWLGHRSIEMTVRYNENISAEIYWPVALALGASGSPGWRANRPTRDHQQLSRPRWLSSRITEHGTGSNGCLQSSGSCESPWRTLGLPTPGALCAAADFPQSPLRLGQRYSKTSPLTVM
jgi:hypothetical protein